MVVKCGVRTPQGAMNRTWWSHSRCIARLLTMSGA
jgi:hypothetical protein